ncbi:MAG: hypothetical protein ACOCWR_10160 [Oceanidesulfovibrio sp.]
MSRLRNAPGVFLVMTSASDGCWSFIEAGESSDVRWAIALADTTLWNLKNQGLIGIAVHYNNDGQDARRTILDAALDDTDSPAG